MTGGPWDATQIACASCSHVYRATSPGCPECGHATFLTRLALDQAKPHGLATVNWWVVVPATLSLWALIIVAVWRCSD